MTGSSSSARASRSITSRARPARCASSRTAAPIGRTSATAASISCAAARIKARTRDHSHVELLLREGLIAESEMRSHPMRNFVECCLGGDVPLPDMSVTARNKLEPGDVLLVCTDGLWSGVEDADLADASRDERTPIEQFRAHARRARGRGERAAQRQHERHGRALARRLEQPRQLLPATARQLLPALLYRGHPCPRPRPRADPSRACW